MRAQAGIARAGHDGAQEHRLEVQVVIRRIVGQMPVRLAEGRHDLRHVHHELSVRVGESRAMAALVALIAFGRVRPDLDTDVRERHAVAGAPHRTGHRKATAADALHNRCAGAEVVGSAPHGRRWR
jgi:hypothetical protein